MSICPICGKEVAPRSANEAFPFCSGRCKSIDLGNWLNEEYRVPATPDEAGEGDESDDGNGPSEAADEDENDAAEADSLPKAVVRH